MALDRWLRNFSPSFRALRSQERTTVRDFAVLWIFFEGRTFADSGAFDALSRASRHWCAGAIGAQTFARQIEYFRTRYRQQIYRDALLVECQSQRIRTHIEETLQRADAPLEDEVLMLLLIIYMLRNNLFHGTKGRYGFSDQLTNLSTANAVLKRLLRIYKRSPLPYLPPHIP